MLGWKAKTRPEEPLEDEENESYEPEIEYGSEVDENPPTWADGRRGPQNPVSRVFGRLPNDADCEARLALAE